MEGFIKLTNIIAAAFLLSIVFAAQAADDDGATEGQVPPLKLIMLRAIAKGIASGEWGAPNAAADAIIKEIHTPQEGDSFSKSFLSGRITAGGIGAEEVEIIAYMVCRQPDLMSRIYRAYLPTILSYVGGASDDLFALETLLNRGGHSFIPFLLEDAKDPSEKTVSRYASFHYPFLKEADDRESVRLATRQSVRLATVAALKRLADEGSVAAKKAVLLY